MERLQKFLSRAGVASRRHAETLITDGRVKVNGKVVDELGSRVDPTRDLVLLDGKLVSASSERKYFLFYKPPGVVTTLSDPEGRPSVGDYAQDTGGRVFPVGRLDYDAEGALLLTDDGELANKLMHPSHQVPRVYLAKVKGVPDQQSLQKLVDGVRLEDGMAHAVQARIFREADRNTWVKIVVTEGRQHLVKRLCAAIGHPVVRLYRPAHAGLPVSGLRPGELRALTNDEIRRVKAAADGDQQPEPPLHLPARRHGHAAPGFEPPPSDDDDDSSDAREPSAPVQEEEVFPVKPSPEPRQLSLGKGTRSERFERERAGESGEESSAEDAAPRLPRERRIEGGKRNGDRPSSTRRSFSGDERPSGRGPKREFGSKREPGAFGAKREPGAFGAKREPGAFGSKREPGAFGAKREPGAFGSKREPGAFGAKREPGAFGSKREPGAFGAKREPAAFGRKRDSGSDERGGARDRGERGGSRDRSYGGERGGAPKRERSFGGERTGGPKRESRFGGERTGGPKREGRFGGERSGGGKGGRFGGARSGGGKGGRFGGGAKRPGGSRPGGRSSPRKPRGSW
ncbi:MAG: pseudouridine synthase [Archangium sp.]